MLLFKDGGNHFSFVLFNKKKRGCCRVTNRNATDKTYLKANLVALLEHRLYIKDLQSCCNVTSCIVCLFFGARRGHFSVSYYYQILASLVSTFLGI